MAEIVQVCRVQFVLCGLNWSNREKKSVSWILGPNPNDLCCACPAPGFHQFCHAKTAYLSLVLNSAPDTCAKKHPSTNTTTLFAGKKISGLPGR